jgi:epoxide hydrolase-like predicted phosphatase
MTIRAVIFDIGGVLELTPPTGWHTRWEGLLTLEPGQLDELLGDVWLAGNVGRLSLGEVERRIAATLGLDEAQLAAFMGDLWDEYCGTLNVELLDYFASLRPRYQTAILSNSFAGAREVEQARYRFADLCDMLIYSHEEGMEKPDPRFFMLACERLGVRPEEVVFLDDVAGHVAAARALGIHGILFESTDQAIREIEFCLAREQA